MFSRIVYLIDAFIYCVFKCVMYFPYALIYYFKKSLHTCNRLLRHENSKRANRLLLNVHSLHELSSFDCSPTVRYFRLLCRLLNTVPLESRQRNKHNRCLPIQTIVLCFQCQHSINKRLNPEQQPRYCCSTSQLDLNL